MARLRCRPVSWLWKNPGPECTLNAGTATRTWSTYLEHITNKGSGPYKHFKFGTMPYHDFIFITLILKLIKLLNYLYCLVSRFKSIWKMAEDFLRIWFCCLYFTSTSWLVWQTIKETEHHFFSFLTHTGAHKTLCMPCNNTTHSS